MYMSDLRHIYKVDSHIERKVQMCPTKIEMNSFQVPSESESCSGGVCHCANDNAIRFLGNTREHNCNIVIEEADFDRHNGTWSCFAKNSYADTVNVTVTTREYTEAESLMKEQIKFECFKKWYTYNKLRT